MKKATVDINVILDAALDLFVHNGLGGTRIEAVAKKSGYGYGTVYYYFPNKESLYQMVAQRASDHYAAVSSAVDPDSAPYEQIYSYFKEFFRQMNTKNGALDLLLLYDVLISVSSPESTRLYVKNRFMEIRQTLFTMLEAVKKDGYAPNRNTSELTDHFIALMIGSAFLKISKVGTAPDPESVLSDLVKPIES